MIILAFDGLEYEYVVKFGYKNLMQTCFGKTDLSGFSKPRTIVIWSSFLSGKNLENEILTNTDLWNFKLPVKRTFLRFFKKFKVIDMPGFNYRNYHKKEKELLKGFFNEKNSIEEYDDVIFKNHKRNKREFLKALNENYDLIMAYFNLADSIGHLSFGIKAKMNVVYKELDDIAKIARKKEKKVFIISDHGMKAVGRFGDHTNYGFWSTSWNVCTKKFRVYTIVNEILKDFF